MSSPLPAALQALLSQGTVVSDGAWGTQLQSLGLPAGDPPDFWNLSYPDRVLDVASRYIAAGSRVILTNTFRSNSLALAAYGAAEKAAELNTAGVRISRLAGKGKALVFASVGPSGKMLAAGDVSQDALFRAFEEQARACKEAGADAILIETMADLDEAIIALAAARPTGLPVAVSMVFDSGRDHDRTMMGTTPEQAAAALTEAGADIIGANCGLGMDGYIAVCARLSKATQRPIWIKPNAGIPEMHDGRIVYRTTPLEFAARAPVLRNAGADFIGGCCGTTPDFIRALAAALRPDA